LIDYDVKSTPLKSLQGKIWQHGYLSGELRAEVFPDVPQAFSRWTQQNRTIQIFSSGSVLAQQLLFANTTCGNLSGFLQGYFDTTTGSKVHPESYRKIAASLSLSLPRVIFISDTLAEVEAAAQAGMETALCVRNNSSTAPGLRYPVISTLDQVFP
jgi:enolase-phosphatase E1